MPDYSFYADEGCSGIWLCIRMPHRGTLMFLLNSCQQRENFVIKEVRMHIEWAYGIVKTFWKLVTKYLFFKLD